MTISETYLIQGLRYVRNTGGGGTKDSLIDDFEPIGRALWRALDDARYVFETATGRLALTDLGTEALKKADLLAGSTE